MAKRKPSLKLVRLFGDDPELKRSIQAHNIELLSRTMIIPTSSGGVEVFVVHLPLPTEMPTNETRLPKG